MAATPAMESGTPAGAVDVPNPTTSLVGMLSANPEGSEAATGAEPTQTTKTGARRRKSVAPDEGQGAGGDATGEPEAAVTETTPEGEEPPAEADDAGDAKALVDSYKKGNERLKERNSKLRGQVLELETKANLLDGYNASINDPATAAPFLSHILETVAGGFYEGDVTKLLGAMGYQARKSEPADMLAGVKEQLFKGIADEVPKMGFADDDTDAFTAFGQRIAEMTLGAVAPMLRTAQPSREPAPGTAAAAPSADAVFARELQSANAAIQEEFPLVTFTEAEAKSAKSAYQRYDLEDALRLTYAKRLQEEEGKQEAKVVVARTMTPSNGKVHGSSPLDPAAVLERAKSGTAISLSDAFAAFQDQASN